MNRLQFQKKVRKWHRYLGVTLGVQFLFWTIGGLYFSWTNIETIRGEDIRNEKPTLTMPTGSRSLSMLTDSLNKAMPNITIDQIQIIDILGVAHYQVHVKSPEKKALLFDAQSLNFKKPLNEQEAIKVAQQSLKSPSTPLKTEYITSTHGHHEYREKPLPAYAITFGSPNNTTVYVSSDLGTIQSYRNNQWRIFDFFWMLHTMDYRERDDFNNWLLRIFSVFGLVTLFSGFALFLLTMSSKPRKTKVSLLLFCVCLGSYSCNDKNENKIYNTDLKGAVAEDSIIKNQLPDKITTQNHSIIMDMILGRPKKAIKSIGILVYDGVNDLDFMGPKYIMSQTGVKAQLIGTTPGHIKSVMGVEFIPDVLMDSIDQLDILIVPGGFKGTIKAAYDAKILNWIGKIDQNTTYTASVCTGAWILGAAGLLKGKKATTNWYREEEFLKKYGAQKGGDRYTQDGKYWSSAGVTAGLDMCLAIIKDNWGDKYAQGVMLDMEYDPAPPIQGGTPQKTGWLVHWMMKAMYDAGVKPMIDSLEKI